ncbi:MAG TPA: POTRA domain-containing protein, partial [bacterium]|nr:POTRA domain-containing protein [bacterium]
MLRGSMTMMRIVFGAILLAASFFAAAPARAERIASITVVGNAQTEEKLVLEGFGLAAGDEYDPEKVRTGIRNLNRQGLFQSVQIEGEESPEGLRLVIRVKENPILMQVRYVGAKKLKEKDFQEAVQLTPGSLVTRQAVERARRDILELYEGKGYLLAEVKAEIQGEQRADVI